MAGPWYRLAVLWQRHSGGKPSEASPLAHGARELYRLLPALAIALAALAIVVTLTQALLARGHAVAPPLASVASSPPSPAATIGGGAAPVEASAVSAEGALTSAAPAAANASTAAAAEAVASFATARPTIAAAAAPSTPAPSATAAPLASMELTVIAPRHVRAQGRIAAPADGGDYWFLIREPERTGVFRQGPAQINAQGAFAYDLDLQPLSVGPDSVVLAAIPKDLSLAWTRQALQTGSWLPVIDVRQGDGIVFLKEVAL
jgi:hypothetical protein